MDKTTKRLLVVSACVAAFILIKNANDGAAAAVYDPALIAAWIDKMKATPDWYAAEVDKANANGITIDEQLLIDAKYCIDQNWTM